MASDKFNNNKHVITQPERLSSAVETHEHIDIGSPEICVICLDKLSEKARALPCNHDQFDFQCLGTWIQQQRVCPLCKGLVKAIRYDDKSSASGSRVFHLPPSENPLGSRQQLGRHRGSPQRHDQYSRGRSFQHDSTSRVPVPEPDAAIEVRRQVYRQRTPSLHVGTNRISQYRNIVPSSFHTNPHLVTRAKIFIRRELNVFDFLNPASNSFGSTDRRASNAEFLLEYVISILKTIDLKSSTGQAEELLKDFLGRDHARLFLHELEAWLRSPYERLEDWDRHVQYSQSSMVRESN